MMNNAPLALMTLAILFATGCREIESGSPSFHEATKPVRVHVGFSSTEMGTSVDAKSVASDDVEHFSDAYLFAFLASGTGAGEPCMVNGAPAAIHTGTKSFEWTLPADVQIEVMAVVNAAPDIRPQLNAWAGGQARFSKDNLLALQYSCQSAYELSELENMPMSGDVTVTMDPDAPALEIPVKRLFAKFDIALDVSGWADDGWTVTTAHVCGARSNTEVPYFYSGEGSGFKQTNPGKFAVVDSSTDEDLDNLDFRDSDNKSKTVSYYFLENCQDVSESASKWSSVGLDLGHVVDNCSYLRINVGATKPGYGERRFGYRIYLDSTPGSAMKSGFNIIRNTYRSITLKLGAPQDGFLWTNTSALTAAPGETVSIPFETTLGDSQLSFLPLYSGIEYVSHTFHDNSGHLTGFPSGGTAEFLVSASAADGDYGIRGGNSAGDISDEVLLEVSSPVSLSYTVPASHYAFQRFSITLHSESMSDWSNEKKARMEEVFSGLSLRCTSEDTRLISTGAAYYTGDILNKQFIVISTRVATACFEAYNAISDVKYEDISVSIDKPYIHFIQTLSSPYSGNGFIGLDHEGDEGPIYDTPITGEIVNGYFQICNDSGTALTIQAEDLEPGSLTLSHVNGFSSTVSRSGFSQNTFVFSSYLTDWVCLEGEGFYSNVDDICEFTSKVYTSNLLLCSESGSPVCAEPVHLKVTNPFTQWFRTDDLTPFSYSVIVDGSTIYVLTEDFSSRWPYSAEFQPTVISHGNVNTSKGGYSPYSLVWESHANEVESLMVANDLHNHGLIEIGGTITHSRTGDTMTMLWGRVSVIREYVIYAGYQFSQVNYLSSASTPGNAGNMSRFIPYIFVRDNTAMPVSLRNCVRTTATSQTGINSVNPSENFYAETCRTEHWWPEHANITNYDHSNSTLWDCEYSDIERSYLLQNKVVVYSSPQNVTSRGELSYYEIQYVGPVVDSHINFFLGHHGHHADYIYSFRSVAYWNQPAFEFHTANINPANHPEVRTFPSGEKYLALGNFTRLRFFWRIKKSSLTKLNSYDTRYSIDLTQTFKTSYTNTGDGSTYYMYYFGADMFRQAYTATAYYDPRRNTREKLKLYTPSIPFYRLQGNTVHSAFDGTLSGSYTEEDIVNSHKMGQAYGTADSFWLPDNQIE